MTYSKQHNGVKDADVDLDIQMSVKTQAGRKCGASSAENMGASGNAIDKNGHWAIRTLNPSFAQYGILFEVV